MSKDERNERSRSLVAAYQSGQAAVATNPRARRLRTEGENAIAELVEINSGLVGAVLSDYRGLGRDERDMLNAAGLGALVIAAQKYDPLNGGPFGAYAASVIRSEMADARSSSAALRKPKGSATVQRIAREVRGWLTTELGREPTEVELLPFLESELLEQAGSEAVMVRRGWRRAVTELQRLLHTDVVALVGPDGSDLELAAEGGDPADALDEAVGTSPLWDLADLAGERWAVFSRAHGLDGLGGATVAEVAEELGLSRADVRHAIDSVRALLANPAAQWALWAPTVPGAFIDSVAADATPSALLGELLPLRPLR
jgi:DNA-directed RNA polymerase specialized sigma subunit